MNHADKENDMIRNAKKSDSINLAALSIQVWLHSYATDGIRSEISGFVIRTFTELYFNQILNDPKFRILVYIKNNHLVGYVMINLESYWKDKKNGYEIDKLYVQEHFHGNGIGRQFLSEIEIQYGGSFWLSTWVNNDKAIGFYKHLGFIDIGYTYFELNNERHENRVLAFKRESLI